MAPATPTARKKSPPTTGAALIEQARTKNRWMAIGLAVFFVTAFITVMAVTVVNNRYYAAQHHAAVIHAAASPRAAVR